MPSARVPVEPTMRGERESVISHDGISSVMPSQPEIDSELIRALAP